MPNSLLRLRRVGLPLALLTSLWLTGCDQLGIESATAIAAKREADGRAIGGGCRHAARSIEQCFESNKRADRAAVFAGWREMEDYMRENKIEAVPVPVEPVSTKGDADEEANTEASAGGAAKTAKTAKTDDSAVAKPASKSDT